MAAAMTLDADGFVRDLMAPNLPLAGRCAVAPGVTVRSHAQGRAARGAGGAVAGPCGTPAGAHRCGAGARAARRPAVRATHWPSEQTRCRRWSQSRAGTYRVTAGRSQESREEIECGPVDLRDGAVRGDQRRVSVLLGRRRL